MRSSPDGVLFIFPICSDPLHAIVRYPLFISKDTVPFAACVFAVQKNDKRTILKKKNLMIDFFMY